METLIFFAFFFFILIPLILAIIIPIQKKHCKATGDVNNYDQMMQKYVYKVSMSREEIINKLKTINAVDELRCDLDLERSVIKFSDYTSSREYFFKIQECDGFSVLRLEQVSFFAMSSHIPLKLNPFFVSKLEAEIIPYSKYGC